MRQLVSISMFDSLFASLFALVCMFAGAAQADNAGISAAKTEALGIHGPAHIGVATNKPFLFLIPATGQAPLSYMAHNLPAGLMVDAKSGVITGTVDHNMDTDVEFMVTDASGKSVMRTVQFTVSPTAIGLTPLMAWNPWYVWGCNIDDAKIRQAADLLVSTGLAAHGYNYINLDDCWAGQRDAQGEMHPNSRFPDMKALSDYVHSKGLRIGIYTSPGEHTCANYPGSIGHTEQDVMTYAKWGFDLIKYDWCGAKADEKTTYRQFSEILARAPRAIYHLMCQYGVDGVWQWGAEVGGNSWRTNDDLADTWAAVLLNGFKNIALAPYQSVGHYNDLDMLMVGKANWPKELGHYDIPNQPPRESQLTLDEKLTHMSLWSMLASPLIFSGDLNQVDAATYAQLTNDDVIAINQDALAKPAHLVDDANNTKTLVREMSDGSTVVAYFNLGKVTVGIDSDFMTVGLPAVLATVKVTNLWTHTDIVPARSTGIHIDVPAHGVVLVKMVH